MSCALSYLCDRLQTYQSFLGWDLQLHFSFKSQNYLRILFHPSPKLISPEDFQYICSVQQNPKTPSKFLTMKNIPRNRPPSTLHWLGSMTVLQKRFDISILLQNLLNPNSALWEIHQYPALLELNQSLPTKHPLAPNQNVTEASRNPRRTERMNQLPYSPAHCCKRR